MKNITNIHCVAILVLLLYGCVQSNNKATTISNPLKDSIAINTFMNFKLGSSSNETIHIIDSLINIKQIENFRKNESVRFRWCYTAASVDRMKESYRFEGSIIAQGESGRYNKYRADIELQFYNDSLYSVFVYPGIGYYFDRLNDDVVYKMLTDKYSVHYVSKTYGPTTIYNDYHINWPNEITKDTSCNANLRTWEFKTSTIGVATLTTQYINLTFDSDSFKHIVANSYYGYWEEWERELLAEEIISKGILLNKKHESYDRIYFWYRNDIIQGQLDNIKAEEEEKHSRYQLEQQQKQEEESKKLKEQFGKQTI